MAVVDASDKAVKADLMVVQLDRARTALAEAKTIGETKKIVDVAHAAQIYARRHNLISTKKSV